MVNVSTYPKRLSEIIELFDSLSESEKRENLIAYADQAGLFQPQAGEGFDLEDIRKDQECADTVAIFLRVDKGGKGFFKVTLGPHVQTLTRAMTSILCEGLSGALLEEILNVPEDFVSKIVGSELVRIRSQTVYYVLGRMKGICNTYLKHKK